MQMASHLGFYGCRVLSLHQTCVIGNPPSREDPLEEKRMVVDKDGKRLSRPTMVHLRLPWQYPQLSQVGTAVRKEAPYWSTTLRASSLLLLLFVFLPFLVPLPQYMEVPRLGV